MQAKILRIQSPARKRREQPAAEALAAILDILRCIERRIERMERVARPLATWEEEGE
jgi:hypothetical protein